MMSVSRIITSLTSPAAVSAFLSTGLISLVPNLLLFLFPALLSGGGSGNSSGGVGWQWGQCLAAGGLIGDVFLHTLPHIMAEGHHNEHQNKNHHHDEPHYEDHHDEEAMDAGIWILIGFFVFFTVDVLLRMTEDILHGTKGHDHHSHSHQSHSNDTSSAGPTSNGVKTTTNNHDSLEKARKSWSLIVLNLTADSLHNFTDGLAIGASYAAAAATTTNSSSSSSVAVSPGSVATLSILLHEVPHELGDYYTLVGAGYTPWQAVRTQFITAIAAFCGTAVALVAADQSSSSDALMLGTAGGFLYLAGTTLLPHVLNESVIKPWHRLGHLMAFAIGLAFMQAVALLEEVEHHRDDNDNHHQDHKTEL